MPHLFCFGLGYSAQVLARRLTKRGWTVTGTTRSGEHGSLAFDGTEPLSRSVFDGVTHLLISVPPGEADDPVLDCHRHDLARLAPSLRWAGYLSTTGVYGDARGEWVDETSPLEVAIGEEIIERYEAGLGRLKSEEREAIVGRVELGLSYAELATALGKPSADAARMTVVRALVKLTEAMDQRS